MIMMDYDNKLKMNTQKSAELLFKSIGEVWEMLSDLILIKEKIPSFTSYRKKVDNVEED